MSKYKIEVVDFGSYLPYLYKKTFWGKWEYVLVGKLSLVPYSEDVVKLQEEYNVPDNMVSFKLKKPTT